MFNKQSWSIKIDNVKTFKRLRLINNVKLDNVRNKNCVKWTMLINITTSGTQCQNQK